MRDFLISDFFPLIEGSDIEGMGLSRTQIVPRRCAASTAPSAWLWPELAAHHTTTPTLLSIGTNVKIMSIY
ncbi:hypothetical protein QUB47_25010 [Microcoleus sp. AT9_B5]